MKHRYLPLLIFLTTIIALPDLQAQCYPDRHNTSLNTSWISCTQSANPNARRESGHWILYDLGEMHSVNGLEFWNVNHPDYLDDGAQSIAIDYTDFNGNWREHGTYSVGQASGSAFYEGETVDIGDDIVTDKILLTLLDNFGGNCSRFSEIVFDLREMTTATEDISEDHFDIVVRPNPFDDYTSIEISKLEGRTIDYQLINSLGQVLLTEKVKTTGNTARFGINGKNLPSGNYFLKIINGQKVSFEKLSHQIK